MLRRSGWGTVTALLACGAATLAFGKQLPPDVRANHWAAGAVEQILQSGILTVSSDKAFHGEAKVTHTQAVIAVAKLAQALEKSAWHPQPSRPVPDKVSKTLDAGDWAKQPVTRFALASILARFGDYFANALPKSDTGDLGKSVVMPDNVKVKVPASHPAYEALTYLTKNRMIQASSPLLKPDDLPIKGAELSRALAEMAAGLNDKRTDLGHDEDGNTPDKTFHSRKPNSRPGTASPGTAPKGR